MTRNYDLWNGTTGTPYTIAANDIIVVTKNVAVSGYQPLAIVQSSFAESGASVGMTFSQVNGTTGNTTTVWRNFTSVQVSSKLMITVLYVKA